MNTGLTEERRRILEAEILFTLAGRIGEIRAWRCEPLHSWWRYKINGDRADSWHESSHAILAELTAVFYVHRISLGATKVGNRTFGGFVTCSTSPNEFTPAPLSPSQPTDRQTIARACVELGSGWRGGIRELHRLRRQSIHIVDEHWPAIRAVARALSLERELDRAAFLAVLESHQSEQQIEIAASGVAAHNRA